MKNKKTFKDRLLRITDQVLLIMNPLLAILNLMVAISILAGYYTPTKFYMVGCSLCLSMMFLFLHFISNYFKNDNNKAI